MPLAPFQLLFRLVAAAMFFSRGLEKVGDWTRTLADFREEYRVPLLPPEVAAPLAAGIELISPPLLVLGLFARLASVPPLGILAVVQCFVYPEEWRLHAAYAALLLFILFHGPGDWSLDRWIARGKGTPRNK